MSCTALVIIDTTVLIYAEYYAINLNITTGRRYHILGKYCLFDFLFPSYVDLLNVRIRKYWCPGVIRLTAYLCVTLEYEKDSLSRKGARGIVVD